jgi:hypothetical protein
VGTRSTQVALLVLLSLGAACSSGGGGTPGGGGPTRSLSGTVTYDFVPATYDPSTGGGTLEFAAATARPVRAGTVQVRKGTTVLATTTTDAAGHYALSFTEPAGTAQVAVLALAESTGPLIQVVDNTDGKAIWAMGAVLGPSTTTVNLHAAHGWTGTAYAATARAAAPFAILDSMYTAARAFLAVRSPVFPDLVVNWSPNNTPTSGNKAVGEIGTSHFAPSENQIYILGQEGIDTDEFDTHVIVHEWGHYFEKNLSRSDSPGGPHSGGEPLDPRLAFGEGYGNAIAAILLPEAIYADTRWDNGGNIVAFGFDAETAHADDPSPGPFSEMTVMRLLYDLWDAGASEGFDGVAVGLGPIFDVLVGAERTTQAFTTIGSFIAGLKAHPGMTAGTLTAIDALLLHYNIGPITDAWGTGDSNLVAMYQSVTPPVSGTLNLDGRYRWNEAPQHRYFVLAGDGSTVRVTATSTQDVGLFVYRAGTQVTYADSYLSGTETADVPTTPGALYVVDLVGFGATTGAYSVDLQFTIL